VAGEVAVTVPAPRHGRLGAFAEVVGTAVLYVESAVADLTAVDFGKEVPRTDGDEEQVSHALDVEERRRLPLPARGAIEIAAAVGALARFLPDVSPEVVKVHKDVNSVIKEHKPSSLWKV
jgi:hypothetical protein